MTPLRPPPKSAIHFAPALMTGAAPYGYAYKYCDAKSITFLMNHVIEIYTMVPSLANENYVLTKIRYFKARRV